MFSESIDRNIDIYNEICLKAIEDASQGLNSSILVLGSAQ